MQKVKDLGVGVMEAHGTMSLGRRMNLMVEDLKIVYCFGLMVLLMCHVHMTIHINILDLSAPTQLVILSPIAPFV